MELMKLKVEIMRVTTARMELELRRAERQEEIARITEHIKIQELKEEELKQKLAVLEQQ